MNHLQALAEACAESAIARGLRNYRGASYTVTQPCGATFEVTVTVMREGAVTPQEANEQLKTKLIQAQALLREVCVGCYPRHIGMIDAFLASSAEPSVQECGNCGASTGQACNDKGCGYLESGNGEPSAPVERNPDVVRQQHYDEFMERREARAALVHHNEKAQAE